MIYFITDHNLKHVKIGYTRNDETLQRRINGAQCWSPYPLILLATCEGSGENEIALHKALSDYRVDEGGGKEWFVLEGAVVRLVDDLRANRYNDLVDFDSDVYWGSAEDKMAEHEPTWGQVFNDPNVGVFDGRPTYLKTAVGLSIGG